MATTSFDTLVSYLRRMTPGGAGEQEDALLLAHFARGDESAFTSLVRRYAPLVWGVCSRALSRSQDAEDAFQPTFLVLARKARSLSGGRPIGPWLHRVASRTAVKARARVARQAARETPAQVEPAVEWRPDALAHEVKAILDEEVALLPEKYRQPVVLCYLEGLTNEEAARRLACPHGTILSRLSRARAQLRGRLVRRGLGFPAVLLAGLLGETSAEAVPLTVVDNLLRAGPALRAGACSASVLSLAEGVLSGMFLSKLKFAGLILLALAVVASGAGMFAARTASTVVRAAGPPRPAGPAAGKEVRPDTPPEKPARPEEKADKPVKAEEKTAAARKLLTASDVKTALAAMVDDPGVDDPKATLIDLLDQHGRRHHLTFDVNERAFKEDKLEDVLKTEIANPYSVAPIKAPLEKVLKKILARVPAASGATFLIRKGGIIEITTEAAVRRELGRPPAKTDEKGQIVERLPPLVWEDFNALPLRSALADLADAADANIVLDPRLGEKATVEVTARLANVPVDTAVHLLADMAGLEVVRMDNVFYVTSAENARKLRPARKTK